MTASMHGKNREGRTRHPFADPEAFGESLYERGFANAEIAVERERYDRGQFSRHCFRHRPRFFGRISDDALPELFDEGHDRRRFNSGVRNHDSPPAADFPQAISRRQQSGRGG